MKILDEKTRLFFSPCAGLAVLLLYTVSVSEKVLIYDEEKGIIFVDKDAPRRGPLQKKEPAAAASNQTADRPRPVSNGKTVDASIQRGRQKDPPQVYFESGLQYFKNDNFEDALKNFTHADSLDPQPKYILWMGKTLRQMGKFDRHLFLMNRIMTTYPESDVADDALFEIAFSYQTSDDYDMASKTYTRLAEQYPFGTSFSNGESFREIAHKQIQMMRAEMTFTLKTLGYNGDNEESLYSAFQKDKGLPITGTGTAETVRAIKSTYNGFLHAEAERARYRQRINKYRTFAAALAALLALNAAALFIVQRNIIAKRKHLAVLHQSLSDLNTGAL